MFNLEFYLYCMTKYTRGILLFGNPTLHEDIMLKYINNAKLNFKYFLSWNNAAVSLAKTLLTAWLQSKARQEFHISSTATSPVEI